MIAASKLDTEKFGKVRELMDRGATDGERQAARSRASAMAARAGITLEAALKQDDSKKAERARASQQSWNADSFYRSSAAQAKHEEAERRRREKEQMDAYWEKRNRELKARFDNAVREHGPAEPVFVETAAEQRLKAFFEPYQVYKEFSDGGSTYVAGLTGWGREYPKETQAQFRKLLGQAIAFPTDLAGLVSEWEAWEALRKRRYAYDPEYEDLHAVQARIDILEELISSTPVQNWHDMDVRLKWMRAELNRDRWRSREDDIAEIERLAADLAFLRCCNSNADAQPIQNGQQSDSVQNGRMTNAHKAEAVKSLLSSTPELSDRAIARKAGVSPQTVNNWRRKLGNRSAAE